MICFVCGGYRHIGAETMPRWTLSLSVWRTPQERSVQWEAGGTAVGQRCRGVGTPCGRRGRIRCLGRMRVGEKPWCRPEQ